MSRSAVTIDQLHELDVIDTTSGDDFYAKVTINGETFTTDVIEGNDNPSPNWIITKSVDSNSGTVPVSIEIWDGRYFKF